MDAAIKKLIQDEFTKASENFPAFNSGHEGYAVILEEFDELTAEFEDIEAGCVRLWEKVKSNDLPGQQKAITELRTASFHAIKEAIQVAAMIERYEANLLIKK